jgi:transcriptional regulator with XRE-family HTH domain
MSILTYILYKQEIPMKKIKKEKLEKKGWKVSTAAEFLGLSPEEEAYVELKVALSRYLHKKRIKKHLTQEQLAAKIKSSQSRVAKMENGDPSVSIDLLVKSLFAMGAKKSELSKAIG